MSDQLNKILTDALDAGHVAGESKQEAANKLKGEGGRLATILTQPFILQCDKLGNSEACIKTFVAPYNLEIVSITTVKTTSADTAVAEMTANAVNPITAATVNFHALTNDTPAVEPLSATPARYEMETGELFKVTWTCGVAGTLDGASLTIQTKPIEL